MTYRNLWERLLPVYDAGEAQAVVRLLLEEGYGLSMADLLTDGIDHLSPAEQEQLTHQIVRLERGEPVQYVMGWAWFCSRRFGVAPGVLIPRPETAELVGRILHDHNHPYCGLCPPDPLQVLDIGTGSGCIATTLALDLSNSAVTAWDISSDALLQARDNARQLGAQVNFLLQDALNPPADQKRWDVIVSNPPYICESERTEMETNVLDHEPSLALFVPDDDPLLFYRAIATNARHMLRPGGALYFEINRNYGKETAALLHALGYTDIEIRKDFMDNDRMIRARWQ